MGTIANAAQGRQLQQMPDPSLNLKRTLEASWPRIQAVIGNNLSPQRLYQLCLSTINREPALAECTVESVLGCFMKCSSLGLEPSSVDGLGRAYILPFGNKNMNGRKEATFILGYKGMIDLARRSGEIKDISARAVYEGDEFTYQFGLDEQLHHVPAAKRGTNLTHVYLVAHFRDGGHYINVMTREEIDAARKRSKAGTRGPWVSDYEAMARKTVVRRSFPYLPVSVQAQEAASVDEQTPDYSDVFHPIIDSVTTPVIDAETAESNEPTAAEPSTAAQAEEVAA
jgi:recombination protein RecT